MAVLYAEDPRVPEIVTPPRISPQDRIRSIRKLLRLMNNRRAEESRAFRFGVADEAAGDEKQARYWFKRSCDESQDAERCYRQIVEHLRALNEAFN